MEISEIVDLAIKILSKYSLCDYCLGRQFASLGTGINNLEKGRALKTIIFMWGQSILRESPERGLNIIKTLSSCGFRPAMKFLEDSGYEKTQQKQCYICGGALDTSRFREITKKILEELNEYEFQNFLVGARIPSSIREKEDAIRSEYMITTGEDIKEDITREIGRLIQREVKREIEYKTPDIVVIVDIYSDTYELQINPVFIKGRYRKLRRDLPQTPWFCRSCWGRGCSKCDYTGREYPESVSELIGGTAVEFFEAIDYKFHGVGREDVDATVLGSGRPFILELKNPRKRIVDLKKLEEKINNEALNKVEVSNLEYSTRRELRLLKSSSPVSPKIYEAIVEFDGDVEDDSLKIVEEELKDRIIDQWTPMRVLKRRADKLRKKKVYYVEAEKITSKIVRFKIKAQGGLYVKELIDGDNGRTNPSIMDIVRRKPLSIQLTVLDVEVLGEHEKDKDTST
ncbi:MAG: tRNA pseudouridine(54/55) synthase Pus10 [Nitrososphaeria archaeon]|nr:tRNA pseudouridine(54/55) synthase Pus10 [Nitrososphaeria archaeon]